MASEIKVYGTERCGLTHKVREFLMRARVAYEYFDIDCDSNAEDFVVLMTDGRRRFPIVVIENRIAVQLTTAELQRVLKEQGVRPPARRRPGCIG